MGRDYPFPLGLFYGACLIALVTESSFRLNLGPGGLLLLPVLAAPVVVIFIATSRMKRQAELLPKEPGQTGDVPA